LADSGDKLMLHQSGTWIRGNSSLWYTPTTNIDSYWSGGQSRIMDFIGLTVDDVIAPVSVDGVIGTIEVE